MYQVLGIQKCLGYFALFCFIIFGGLSFWRLPEVFSGFSAFWPVAKMAMGISTIVLLGLGQTPLFPWICKLPVVRRFFPPSMGTGRSRSGQTGMWSGSLQGNLLVKRFLRDRAKSLSLPACSVCG